MRLEVETRRDKRQKPRAGECVNLSRVRRVSVCHNAPPRFANPATARIPEPALPARRHGAPDQSRTEPHPKTGDLTALSLPETILHDFGRKARRRSKDSVADFAVLRQSRVMMIYEAPDSSAAPMPDCAGCGREAAVVIDGKGWCVDCFHNCGSCCAGDES